MSNTRRPRTPARRPDPAAVADAAVAAMDASLQAARNAVDDDPPTAPDAPEPRIEAAPGPEDVPATPAAATPDPEPERAPDGPRYPWAETAILAEHPEWEDLFDNTGRLTVPAGICDPPVYLTRDIETAFERIIDDLRAGAEQDRADLAAWHPRARAAVLAPLAEHTDLHPAASFGYVA